MESNTRQLTVLEACTESILMDNRTVTPDGWKVLVTDCREQGLSGDQVVLEHPIGAYKYPLQVVICKGRVECHKKH